jgi:hypothetical protein
MGKPGLFFCPSSYYTSENSQRISQISYWRPHWKLRHEFNFDQNQPNITIPLQDAQTEIIKNFKIILIMQKDLV